MEYLSLSLKPDAPNSTARPLVGLGPQYQLPGAVESRNATRCIAASESPDEGVPALQCSMCPPQNQANKAGLACISLRSTARRSVI